MKAGCFHYAAGDNALGSIFNLLAVWLAAFLAPPS